MDPMGYKQFISKESLFEEWTRWKHPSKLKISFVHLKIFMPRKPGDEPNLEPILFRWTKLDFAGVSLIHKENHSDIFSGGIQILGLIGGIGNSRPLSFATLI